MGEIEETLKWGEPSYLTSKSKSGSTIRIDWKEATPENVYVYFNCKTTLIADIKDIYNDVFSYGGNRSLIFQVSNDLPVDELSGCIEMALTYHLRK